MRWGRPIAGVCAIPSSSQFCFYPLFPAHAVHCLCVRPRRSGDVRGKGALICGEAFSGGTFTAASLQARSRFSLRLHGRTCSRTSFQFPGWPVPWVSGSCLSLSPRALRVPCTEPVRVPWPLFCSLPLLGQSLFQDCSRLAFSSRPPLCQGTPSWFFPCWSTSAFLFLFA